MSNEIDLARNMPSKVCPRCKENKSLDKFKMKKGKATYCRLCNKRYYSGKRKYQGTLVKDPVTGQTNLTAEHKRAVKQRNWKVWAVAKKENARAYIASVLKGAKCMDCPCTNWIVLQFDHRDPSTKEFDISRAVGSGVSIKRLTAEVAKCDIVCPTCHAVRTAAQFGNWRLGLTCP